MPGDVLHPFASGVLNVVSEVVGGVGADTDNITEWQALSNFSLIGCIGAFLLDLNETPTRVIGRLREPLLAPNESEREGYVPSVVYACGALLHGRAFVIPYAMSDSASSFATVALAELLAAME